MAEYHLHAVRDTDVVASDERLALLARDGHDAFAALYDRYIERLQRYIYSRTGGSADIEDLVATTFLRALTRIETFRPERGSFAAWLFAIARNVVSDEQRRAVRVRSFARWSERVVDSAPNPEDVSLGGEERAAVRRCGGHTRA